MSTANEVLKKRLAFIEERASRLEQSRQKIVLGEDSEFESRLPARPSPSISPHLL
jgi:hypothetical protein